MISADIFQRVFHVGMIDDHPGSGFTVEYEDKQYLISAKHVFESVVDNQETTIRIFHDGSWKKILVRAHVHEKFEIDIIVFSLITPKTLSHNQPLLMSQGPYAMGQDSYFLGFPYKMFTDDSKEINRKFPFPFIKKAIFSAIENTESDGRIIYLDGHLNPGFSGGPLLFRKLNDDKIAICGVVTGYIKQDGEIPYTIEDDNGQTDSDIFSYNENSGLFKAQDIKHVLEILKDL